MLREKGMVSLLLLVSLGMPLWAFPDLGLWAGLAVALALTCLTRSLILDLLFSHWAPRCALLSAVLAALPSAGALGLSLCISAAPTRG